MDIWDYLLGLDIKIQTALIAAATSILTFILSLVTKNYLEGKSYTKKLEKDYTYEQRKKVKDAIAAHKGHLLNAASSLNGRLKNLTKVNGEKWLNVDGEYTTDGHLYFKTFVYRVLSFYAWINVLEDELIYMDTFISAKEDIEFLKFLRVFPLPFYDGDLVDGIKNENGDDNLSAKEINRDIIYKDIFNSMYLWMITPEKKVISFEEFLSTYESNLDKISPLFSFLDGINPRENRFRWDRIYVLQILLVGFLNKFGYDFHKTDYKYLNELIDRQGKKKTFKNIDEHIFKKFKIKSGGMRLIKFAIRKHSK
jgi:hypothetical protein